MAQVVNLSQARLSKALAEIKAVSSRLRRSLNSNPARKAILEADSKRKQELALAALSKVQETAKAEP